MIPPYLSLQQEQVRIESAFDKFDLDNDGHLNTKEVSKLMQELNDGVSPTPEEVNHVMRRADVNRNGLLERAEVFRRGCVVSSSA